MAPRQLKGQCTIFKEKHPSTTGSGTDKSHLDRKPPANQTQSREGEVEKTETNICQQELVRGLPDKLKQTKSTDTCSPFKKPKQTRSRKLPPQIKIKIKTIRKSRETAQTVTPSPHKRCQIQTPFYHDRLQGPTRKCYVMWAQSSVDRKRRPNKAKTTSTKGS